MKKILPVFIVLAFVANLAKASSYDASVDINGTGDYSTVQAAINAAPADLTSPYRIFIKSGVYYENITINKKFIQLIGENVAKTIITYNNYNGKTMPGGGTYGTANSASVTINGNDFSAANITFENTTGDAPQALAINVSADRASFKNCRFLGGQDTFLGYNSKYPQSLYKCYIEGVVDFIFGNSKTVFDECTIYARDRSDNNGSYITASNTRESKGLLFRNCEIIANRGVTKYVLGRPWQNDAATADKSTAATVFINTKMSPVVKPEGWSVWDTGTDVSKIIYAEFNSMNMDGTPLDISSRVSWSKQLNATEAAEYLDNNIVFKDRNDNVWDPYAVFLDGNAVPSNRLAISNFKYKKTGTELTFTWNLNWPENNVTYRLYRIADGGAPTLVSEQTITGNNVNLSYAPSTSRESVPPSMSTYEYYVEASSANGTVRSESAFISAIPVISTTGILQTFKQGIDKPSASQVMILNGEYLHENVTVTPSNYFEVSADNGVTWKTHADPLVLPVTGGLLATKTILVRLNATVPGLYSGDLTIVSGTGSWNKAFLISGETYDHPLVNSKNIASLTLAENSSATYLKEGLVSSSIDLSSYIISSQAIGTNVPYSPNYGIQFAPTAAGGGWLVLNEIKNMSDKTKYIELSLKTAATHEARIDSLLFNLAVFNTTGNFAMEYSKDNFQTSAILNNVLLNGTPIEPTTYGVFIDGTFPLGNQNTGVKRYAVALNSASGVELDAGQELKIRFYFRTGSSSDGRYVTLKNIDFKGDVGLAAADGDYRTVSSGSWLDASVWRKLNSGTWETTTTPPHFGTGHTSFIESGHIVIAPHSVDLNATYANSYGYVNSIVVKEGGKLIVESGKTLNIHKEQLYQIDGEFENNGTVGNDGKYDLIINGTATNNGTLKVDQPGSNVFVKGKLINKSSVNYNNVTVKDGGTYEHAANSDTMPANIIFEDGSTFLVSGISTSQTGILKNSISYYNIIWDNPNQTKYYAFQGNLAENVRGKFTVNNTGTQYLALLNSNGTIGLGCYEQNGGRVLVRENGTVNALINVAGDFIVNGGTFESNATASLKINLNGTDSKYRYDDSGNRLTGLDIDVTGDYSLQSPLSTQSLNIFNGKLTLGSFNLTAKSISRAGTGYIVTNGIGSLIYKNISTDPVLLPIGISDSYTPLTIKNTGTVSDFNVRVKTGIDNALPTNPTKSVNLQWDISPVTMGAKADIDFQWNADNHNSGFNLGDPVVVANYHSVSYVGFLTTVSGSGPFTAGITGVEQFSPFIVVNEVSLPLKIVSFTGKRKGKSSVVLSWQTAEEYNTSHFIIERAGTDLNFVNIGSLKTTNISGTNLYSFIDDRPLDENAYYRLIVIDKDGKRQESGIVSIKSEEVAISLYPNPAIDRVLVNHTENSHIVVSNVSGKKIYETYGGISNFTAINVSDWPSGIYILYLKNDTATKSLKFVKQ